MKKTVIFAVLTALSLLAHAQGYSNAKNLNFAGGYNFKNGYVITAGYEKLFGVDNSLRIDARYFNSKDEIEALFTKIDIHNILAGATLNRYISLYKTLLSFGAGGTAGYQFFSFDKPDYIDKTEDNRFVYGFNGVAQLEFNISSVSIFTEYKAIYLFNSREKFNHHIALGLKKYF